MALMVAAEDPNFYNAELIPPVASQPNNVEQEQDPAANMDEFVVFSEMLMSGLRECCLEQSSVGDYYSLLCAIFLV